MGWKSNFCKDFMAAPTLQDVKSKVRQAFLGKNGIHGVGIRESESALCLYMDSDAPVEDTETLKAIKAEASPYKVIVIREERPAIT